MKIKALFPLRMLRKQNYFDSGLRALRKYDRIFLCAASVREQGKSFVSSLLTLFIGNNIKFFSARCTLRKQHQHFLRTARVKKTESFLFCAARAKKIKFQVFLRCACQQKDQIFPRGARIRIAI